MRVVYMGTPDFSAKILGALSESFEVVGVYTRPDAIRGRGKSLVPSPVKQKAVELGLPVFTPKSLRDAEVQQELASLRPDVICVAAYGAILPVEVLEMPQYGCVNVHASLLPRWRGAAPVERAILSGDEYAGVCIMRMEEGLDTGAYCSCAKVAVEGKSSLQLTECLAEMGSVELCESLNRIASGSAEWTEQDESFVTYAHKIEQGELNVGPGDDVRHCVAKVLASSDAHPSKCVVAGKGVTIIDVCAANDEVSVEQGKVLFQAKRLYFGCADGAIEVLEVKPDGKKAMEAKAFAAGVQGVKQGNVEWGELNG